MATVKYVKPVAELHGKICTPKDPDEGITIFRRKCYGTTKRGKKLLGPKESYQMHKHEGAWSVGAEENRKSFGTFTKQAYEELRDPERKAYWEALFEEQIEHPKGGKRYVRLASYVAAKLKEQGNLGGQ